MPFPESFQLSPNRAESPPHERRGVLFHHTEMPCADCLAFMADPSAERSYHAIIREDGARFVLVPDEQVAWHAGASTFHGRSRCNDFLLGLAFAGDTALRPLTDAQIASALEWLEARWTRYGWSLEWMTDHRSVSPGRKRDLEPAEWDRLRAALARHFAREKARSAPGPDISP